MLYEVITETTPFSYPIIVAGDKWEDCICKSITIEAVPATGQGNRSLVKESPEAYRLLPPLPPVEETMGRWNGQPLLRQLPNLQKVLAAVNDRNKFKRLLRGAVMLNNPQLFAAFQDLAYKESYNFV